MMSFHWQRVCQKPKKASDLVREMGYLFPPVDIKQLALRLGATVLPMDGSARMSGLLLVEGGKATISVRNTDSVVRQRFTLAHEVGHLLLHAGPRYLVTGGDTVEFRDTDSYPSAQTVEDQQANGYAARLLIPDFMLNSLLLVESNPTRLAEIFAVSPEAMRHRLSKTIGLGLMPVPTSVT